MTDNLWVRESFVNTTEGYMFGEGDWYETYSDDRGRLFRSMQKEYGRCISRMYVDQADGVHQIGWVFEQSLAYEDAPKKKYTREVWVQVSTTPVHLRTEEVGATSPWEQPATI